MMKKQLTTLILLVFLFGCAKEKNNLEITNKILKDSNFVDLSTAKSIAIQESFNTSKAKIMASKNTKASAKAKIIKQAFTIDPNKSEPSFYILNYDDGGFAIVSADKRAIPILAYADKGNFEVSEKINYPPGLVAWLQQTNDGITEIRKKNLKPTETIKKSWKNLLEKAPIVSNQKKLSLNGRRNELSSVDLWNFPCDRFEEGNQLSMIVAQVGPLLQTQWGQGTGYNDLCPHMGCSNYSNGRAPTGCYATAIAQILRYHAKPSMFNFNWTGMSNNYGNADVQYLMSLVGQACSMDYGCDGSGATDGEAIMGLQTFGYGQSTAANYNYSKVKFDLNLGRPVILTGGKQGKWWIFNSYEEGHAWVCDGYKDTYMFECMLTNDPRPEPGASPWMYIFQVGYGHLSMNWGWNGSYNGWYAFDNWNPAPGYTFNYKKGMITDIY
ncbi:C10 family peptidase [Pedobacter sp. R-06]|uniref:C10 family peptidase n=1 Tax=Pedobacter sp. R-06 TaxID=3404051 RepID=UPI003CF00494